MLLRAAEPRPARSVASVEEERTARDDVAGGVTVRCHLEGAEELLSVQVEVHGSINRAGGVRLRLVGRDPGQLAVGQLNDFASLSANLADLGSIKCTALKEQALNLDATISLQLARLKCGDKLELIDGNLVDAGRLLAEGVQERLWVQQVRDAYRLVQQLLRLDSLDPLNELRALLAEDADPGLRIFRAFPLLLPGGWYRIF